MGRVVQPAPITEDDWSREATHAAVAAAQAVVQGGSINSRATVGSLGEIEWGWIVCAAIFGWIETKARQAVSEGRSVEDAVRAMPRDPAPWESGAVATILPALGKLDLDWSKPVGEWSKDQIVGFAWRIHKLTDEALAARDEGATDKIVRFARDIEAREYSAAHGGGLMTAEEISEPDPFIPLRAKLPPNGDELPF
jgi:hypothetical protein